MMQKLFLFVCLFIFSLTIFAQTPEKPLTQTEFVQMLYQLPKYPAQKDELIETVRKRGIDFPLTNGLRGLVASKSVNDA